MPAKKSRAAKAAKKIASKIESTHPAAKRDRSGIPAANFLFAGDFNVQSIRYETKSAFPVHRYGFSYEVHRHKCFSGPFLLKHLVEQCFDYLGVSNLNVQDHADLRSPEGETDSAKREVANSKRIRNVLANVEKTRHQSIKAKVWQRARKSEENTGDSEDLGTKKTVPLTVYHESVSILRDSGMRETAGNAPSDCLFAPRILDSHSITHSQPLPEIFDVDVKAFGETSLSSPDIVLSLDLKNFGTTEDDFESLTKELAENHGSPKGPAASANVITRMVIPRAVVNQPKPKSKLGEFIKHYGSFIDKHRKNREQETKKRKKEAKSDGNEKADGVSVLVIGSESLRNAGLDISYRVTWERTISSIVREIRKLASNRPKGSAEDGSVSGGPEDAILRLVAMHDYIVVCFYNDGALIIPTALGKDGAPDGDAILVAAPSQIEGDHWYRFCGTMKGTGSLVAAGIAFHLRCPPQEDEQALGHSQLIQKAVVLGLKSSRYLQSHGYSTLHRCAYQVLNGIPFERKTGSRSKADDKPKAKDKAYRAMVAKLGSSNLDVIRYFWNRTRSIIFAKEDLVPLAIKALDSGCGQETKICIWPLGDLVEILVSGHPTFGSFPPVGLKLDEGREAIDKETHKVLEAWNDCGWLEVGRFRWRDASPVCITAPSPASGYPYWSLRSVGVERLAIALRAGLIQNTVIPDEKHRIVARFLIAEMMVRFGTKRINRDGMDAKEQFDYKLIKRVIQYGMGELPHPHFYGEYFQGLDPVLFVSALTNTETDRRELTYEKFSDFEENHELLLRVKHPTYGSLLGMFPEFSLRKLHTIDSRDTQSFRDIRERLLNFQASKEFKPLNLLVLGSPGAGKSFGVKQIIEGVFGPKEVVFLEYNLASFSGSKESLTSAFLEIQNAALENKLPVVFWDEFDTTVDDVKLSWFGAFLGPMQDGRFLIGQSSRNLPKCVFVFAGSVFSKFEQVRMLDALQGGRPDRRAAGQGDPSGFATTSGWSLIGREESTNDIESIEYEFTREGDQPVKVFLPADNNEWRKAKGRDFKSRITGVLDIASVDPRTKEEVIFGLPEDDDAWLFRRASAVRHSFEALAGHLLNREKELQISGNTLFSFLTFDCFDHGYRSIENLVRMSSLHERAIADGSVVPTDAQVRIHCGTDLFGSGSTRAYDSEAIARMFTYK